MLAVNRIFDSFKNMGILGIALTVSIALHAALLLVRIANSEGLQRLLEDTPLEVILVNAQSKEAPEKAQAIAQYNLQGGGDDERENVFASSPAPNSALTEWGQDAENQERQTQELLENQVQILAAARRELAQMRRYTQQEVAKNPEAAAAEEKRRALLNQLGAIERRINDENSRPKKRFISPATKAGSHAHYYAAFKDRVEELGTTNFPIYNGQRLYGELSMIVTLDANGQVLQTEILQSSGQKALDRIAQAIVRAGAPYGKFSPEMLKEFGVLIIASRFRFTRDAGMSTTVQEAASGAGQ
jgi:protein TonB